MERRCMTPNSHSQTKYLSELVEDVTLFRPQTPKINYDAFFYVDRLTKNKIMLGQAKNIYSQKQKKANTKINQLHNSHASHTTHPTTHTFHPKQQKKTIFHHQLNNARIIKQYSQQKQMQQINNCFTIMKSTKLFEMQNLKNKLFTKNENNQCNDKKQNNEIQSMIKKKKKIRQFIQQYLNNICLNQFRKYMQPTIDKQKIKFINPNILNIHKSMSNKINKHNIQKIIQQFLQSQTNKKYKKSFINININDVNFPDQERLKQLLIHRILLKNKEFQYLVTPGHGKQIFNQIHTHGNTKYRNKDYSQIYDKLKDYKFHQISQRIQQKIQKNKTINWNNMDQKIKNKKKQLLIAIESGSIYDLLYLIIRQPNLLQYKDKLGNNLLHVAAKQNQFEIYNILIQKLGVQALKQKNYCGKTPIQISQLYGSQQTQQINQQYIDYL